MKKNSEEEHIKKTTKKYIKARIHMRNMHVSPEALTLLQKDLIHREKQGAFDNKPKNYPELLIDYAVRLALHAKRKTISPSDIKLLMLVNRE